MACSDIAFEPVEYSYMEQVIALLDRRGEQFLIDEVGPGEEPGRRMMGIKSCPCFVPFALIQPPPAWFAR